MKLLLIIGLVIGASYAAPFEDDIFGETMQRDLSDDYRLNDDVIPSNYKVELTPYFTTQGTNVAFTFDGLAEITIRTSKLEINQIVLHVNDLEINTTATSLYQAIDTSAIINVVSVNSNTTTHKYTLNLAAALRVDVDYILSFKYVGYMRDDMHGFYRSSYVQNGVTKWLGTTQFQPTHARRVIPSFDEPKFKAVFKIIINRPTSFEISYSNAELESTVVTSVATVTTDTFKDSPLMSTYLVAFIVSEFKLTENTVKNFGVIARPEAILQADYSLREGEKILIALNNYLDFSYFLTNPKMYMAAVPDFSAGAMENWGLLTYRETNMLYDADYTTSMQQQRIAAVLAHEEVHMWFGDLITCDWWSYTWLNEGFARYFQYFGTAMAEPDWDLHTQFVVEQVQAALAFDSTTTTHPLNNENVNTPGQVSAMFSTISYNKGAAVLRMVEHMMSNENFTNTIREYIKVNQYKTARPTALYTALQQEAPEDVMIPIFMGRWATQTGYPVLTVEVNRQRVTLTQNRYYIKKNDIEDETTWDIPLTFATDKDNNFENTQYKTIMTNAVKGILFDLPEPVEWIIFNIQQTGFYRVNYDDANWLAIGQALKKDDFSGIHSINRAQIVDDLLNFVRSELVSFEIAMDVLSYLENETEYAPWLAYFNGMAYITRRFTESNWSTYKKYFLYLSENVYKHLGTTPTSSDSRIDLYNRVNILAYSCKYGLQSCNDAANLAFEKYQTTSELVPVDIRVPFYCAGVRNGGDDEWNFLWEKYETQNVATEQATILTALGCTKDKTLIYKYFDNILSDKIRSQDRSSSISSMYINEDNIAILFEYIKENHANISTVMGGYDAVASLLSTLAGRFPTSAMVDELSAFYTANQALFGTSTTISSAIDNAKFDFQWANNHVASMHAYMEDVVGGASMASVSFIALTFSCLLSYLFL